MKMKRVLVGPGDFLYSSPEKTNLFKKRFNVTVLDSLENLKDIIKDYDAVLSRHHIAFTKEVLDNAKNLKVIARMGAGYEEIDVHYAAKKGIWVTNTPNVIAKATADVTICHLLNISRRFSESERWLRQGNFHGGWAKFLGKDPVGKTLGIIGMGNIGKEVAKRASALEMKIIYHNRKPASAVDEAICGNAKFVSKDELLSQSDYISVNVFASPETKHILDYPDFAKMKNGVFIINTSRGVTINEQALVDALKSGKVAGAGLDVFEKEPQIHPDLKTFPNVSLTPHIGTATYDTRAKMEELAIANVESVLNGKTPPTPVPECRSLISEPSLARL